jgi:predicted nucleotidyltransferase
MKIELLNEVVERCRNALRENLVSVVLFGSVARGLQDSRSDTDLLIVVEEEGKDDYLRDIRIHFLLNHASKLDIIIMDKKDTKDNFKCFSPLFLSFALGITILWDTGFFQREYSKFLSRLKDERIKYVEGGKVWDLQEISSKNLQQRSGELQERI